MTPIIFASHTFVKRLRATGFTKEQAEVIDNASRDALSNLMAKGDLVALEQRLVMKLGVFIAIACGIVIAVLRLPH